MKPPLGSKEWSVEFYRDESLSHRFAARLLFLLVSRGVRFGGGNYPAQYSIFEHGPDEFVKQKADDRSEQTEELGTVLDEYRTYDPERTSLTVSLDYLEEPTFYFWIKLSPRDGKTRVAFETHTNYLDSGAAYDTFVQLCREAFVRFQFVYGSYRTEYDGSLPLDRESILRLDPRRITFYSADLVEALGREYVLDAPAERVEELDNGGVLLLLSTEREGRQRRSEVKSVGRYLSHAWPGENPYQSGEED